MNVFTFSELEQKAQVLRQYILAMAYYAGGAHISPTFSAIDIMTALYCVIEDREKHPWEWD